MPANPEVVHLRGLVSAAIKAGARFEPPPQPTPKPAPGTFVVAPGDNVASMPVYSPWYSTPTNPNPNPSQAELDSYYAASPNGTIPFVPGLTSYPATSVPSTPTPQPTPGVGQMVAGPNGSFSNGKRVFNAGSLANDQTVKNGDPVTQDGVSYTAVVTSGPLGITEITFVEN